VSYVVDKQGRPRNLTVARSVDRHLDRAALEVIAKHRFETGTADARPICVPMTAPITFRLE
jgi:TonB family protein